MKKLLTILYYTMAVCAWGASYDDWYYGGHEIGGYDAPKIQKGVKSKVFRQLHAEQISEMYRLKDGKEWILVKTWDRYGQLRKTTNYSTIPRQHKCEIHSHFKEQMLEVRIVNEKSEDDFMAILTLTEGMDVPKVGDVLNLWLIYKDYHCDPRGGLRYNQIIQMYDAIPPQEAARYTTPTVQEAAAALKGGMAFVVKMKMKKEKCQACRGTGINTSEIRETLQKADEQERHGSYLSVPSGAYTRAKLNKDKPRCNRCEGRGYTFEEELRKLIF